MPLSTFQRTFGHSLGDPLGHFGVGILRESNDRGHYHYFAYGLPGVLCSGLRRRLDQLFPPIPLFSRSLSIRRKLCGTSARWSRKAGVGPYGFYEAVDYSVSSRKPVLVREWMAHHLGMFLLAIANSLRNNVVQQWFHASPHDPGHRVGYSTRFLSNTAVLEARLKHLAPIHFHAKVSLPELSRSATAAL